jgi:4a-hydroxytetrahydrobiopterin dehydratase
MSPVSQVEIEDFLLRHPGWRLENKKLKSEFTFVDFKQAKAFIDIMAEEAETMDHHPEWRNRYNKVDVALITDDMKTITTLDLAMAKSMEYSYELIRDLS